MNYVACIAEGAAETAIIDILLSHAEKNVDVLWALWSNVIGKMGVWRA